MTFNFLPANQRGGGDYGWLKTNYSFSFSNYYDPKRMGFGPLRVLNDDTISGGGGFPAHSHRDMEIITLVLEGSLAHKDNTGTEANIQAGDVQIMSAGTGITHSEYNASDTEAVKLFQIWIEPHTKNLPPRYDQKNLNWLKLIEEKPNTWHTIASPEKTEKKSQNVEVQIFQSAWLSVAGLEAGSSLNYNLKKSNNGIFLMLIEGEVGIAEQTLTSRDVVEINDVADFEIKSNQKSSILIIEVPII